MFTFLSICCQIPFSICNLQAGYLNCRADLWLSIAEIVFRNFTGILHLNRKQLSWEQEWGRTVSNICCWGLSKKLPEVHWVVSSLTLLEQCVHSNMGTSCKTDDLGFEWSKVAGPSWTEIAQLIKGLQYKSWTLHESTDHVHLCTMAPWTL